MIIRCKIVLSVHFFAFGVLQERSCIALTGVNIYIYICYIDTINPNEIILFRNDPNAEYTNRPMCYHWSVSQVSCRVFLISVY